MCVGLRVVMLAAMLGFSVSWSGLEPHVDMRMPRPSENFFWYCRLSRQCVCVRPIVCAPRDQVFIHHISVYCTSYALVLVLALHLAILQPTFV